jgi:hypothetical protein
MAPVVSADDMPEDNADLARLVVKFDRLLDDSPQSSPVAIQDVLDYLTREVPGGDLLSATDLTFQQTAAVGTTRYWIWSFDEPDGGEPAYATVSEDNGQLTVGYDANYYGLTPEQFMLGEYHGVF